MNKEQKMFLLVWELNKIIDTPSNIFEERMVKYARSIQGLGVEPPEIKTGVDYKMLAIRRCARELKSLID